MIETKVSVGSFTGILTGLITWALVAYVPAFRSGVPAPVAALIPVMVAWLAHSVAAYAAPHTPRDVGLIVPGQSGKAATGAVTVIPPSTGPATDPPAPGAAV